MAATTLAGVSGDELNGSVQTPAEATNDATIAVYDAAPSVTVQNDALSIRWEGITDIERYRIEFGHYPNAFTGSITQTWAGPETLVPLANLPADACFIRVMPVKITGDTLFSPTVRGTGAQCQPSLTLERTPAYQEVQYGRAAGFVVTLTNTSPDTLTGIHLSGSAPGCNLRINSLAAGGSLVHECSLLKVTESQTHTFTLSATGPGNVVISRANPARVAARWVFYLTNLNNNSDAKPAP